MSENRNKVAEEILGLARILLGSNESTSKNPVKEISASDAEMQLRLEVRAMVAKTPDRVEITELPGMGSMQVKSWIDSIVKARHELAAITHQHEAIIKKMKGLEADEKKGVAVLTAAAKQMQDKTRYLVDTENGLLEFTAYLHTARPGIKQILFDPDETPVGEKAGALIERVSQKLGDEVASAVADIYRECYEDLTHATAAVKLLKVIDRTASVDDTRLKKAGLSDFVVSIKDWLAGGTDSIIKRILDFSGDINKWLRGFVERTNIVKNRTDKVKTNIDKMKSTIDDYIALADA